MEGEVEDEDLIQREDCVVTVSPRATSSACRSPPIARSAAAARAARACRRAKRMSSPQIFVASTHTPVLFFSSRGMCYRMKVWRLPAATPQAVGKALVNLLPLAQGEVITSILPLPEDAETWGALQLDVRHALRQRAAQRAVRFREHQPQRQDRHEARRGRSHRRACAICTPENDVLLTTRAGPLHPLPASRTRCACSRAAIPTACAASGSTRATR